MYIVIFNSLQVRVNFHTLIQNFFIILSNFRIIKDYSNKAVNKMILQEILFVRKTFALDEYMF